MNEKEEGDLSVGPDFDGPDYVPPLDRERLTTQLMKVYSLMRDGNWRTLGEISEIIEEPEASISARIRDLRKKKFGSFIVPRRRRGDPKKGLWEYSVLPPDPDSEPERRKGSKAALLQPNHETIKEALIQLELLYGMHKNDVFPRDGALVKLCQWLRALV